MVPSVANFESKSCSLRFLTAMTTERAGYSLIWSRLSHGMNHVRHGCVIVHEPAERMFLLSKKVGKILSDEGISFGFGHWNKAVRFGFR